MSTGKTPGGIFAANAHCSYSMSFAYFNLHHALDKNSYVEALYANSYGKIKSRKKSLDKGNEKAAKRRKKKLHFVKQRKKTLPKATKSLGLSVDPLDVLFFSGTFSAFNPSGAGFSFLFTFANITWSS